MPSLSNGGPLPKRLEQMPVDYKGGELPYPVLRSFHHIAGTALFFT